MTSNEFIDRLERELRAASRRRVRLELARVPRVPPGIGVLLVAAVIAAAVAVPVLAAHSGSPATRPAPRGTVGGSVVVGCGHAVSGRLPADWRSPRAGTLVTGPITWIFLSQDAPHAVITRTQLIEALAVVEPGHDVTVSVPRSSGPRQMSLDYTDVSPRSAFHLSQGASSVTFKPCPGPVGHTQFVGGFILSRAQCAAITVHVVGSSRSSLYLFPLGRSCGQASRVLKGDGIGRAKFGEGPKAVVRKLDGLLRRRPTKRSFGKGQCGVDGEIDWPGLEAYFDHRRYVGYSYGSSKKLVLATERGLELGDTVRTGRRIYGSAFKVGAAQGGNWLVDTRLGRIGGFLSDITRPGSRVLTIEAGKVGCPALSP